MPRLHSSSFILVSKNFKIDSPGDREVALVVKCILYKHGDLDLISRSHSKGHVMILHLGSTNTEAVDRGKSPGA